MSEKIGIFGGTFNPIHYGHLNSLETVLDKLELDKILVVPTSQNPLRTPTEGPTPEERLMMAQLAVENLGNTKVEVSPVEVARGGASYTVDTVEELKKKDSQAEYYLILGGDHLDHFDRWKDFEKIVENANLVFTSRPGNELPKSMARIPSWLRDRLDDFDKGVGLFKTGKSLQFIQLEDVDISSTEVRRLARRGLDIRKDTPTKVADYIKANQIYDRVGKKIPDFFKFTEFCAQILDAKGGINIQAFDVREIEQPTDFTVVLSGTSSRHVLSLLEYVSQAVKDEYGVYPQGVEGGQEGRWVVVDYGGLMIHIFYDFVRNEYRLEELWRDGKRLSL